MENRNRKEFSPLKAFPEVKIFLLSALEELSNRALQYDEASRLAIQSLDGHSLRIESRLPLSDDYFDFVILFCDKGLIFSAEPEAEADALVRASTFITVARFFSGKFVYADNIEQSQQLIIEGNLGLVNQVQDIFSQLDVDWEEPLSQITGDVVAHELGRFANDAGEWVKKAGELFESELDSRLNTLSKLFFRKSRPDRIEPDHASNVTRNSQAFAQEIENISDMQVHAEKTIDQLENRSGRKGK